MNKKPRLSYLLCCHNSTQYPKIVGADHMFSDARSNAMLQNLTLTWLASQINGNQNNAK